MKKIIARVTKNKTLFILVTLLYITTLVTSGTLISFVLKLDGVANSLRYIGIILLILFLIFLFVYSFRKLIRQNKLKLILLILFYILFNLAIGYVTYNAYKAYDKLASITTTEKTYSTSIVTLVDKESINYETTKIGMLSDENNVEGYQIATTMIDEYKIDKNTIRYYDSYITLLEALYTGEVESAFLPTNYSILFATVEGYENLNTETKIHVTKTETVVTKPTEVASLTEPFTILLMGVDSETENIAESSFNGDSLILLTVNPNTLTTTMMSIPRDTYVPITCFSGERKNKITHAAWYGEDCMVETIENFTDIDIDYYVKINFKGLVKLVDTLGGITVDVPYSFCEQDSNRTWGANTVYVEEGIQTLTGEQALALARNRHPNPDQCSSEWTDYVSNDFIRGENQQLIISALLEQAKTITSLEKLQEVLDVISISMETNLQTSEIFSLYDVGMEVISMSSDAPIDQLVTIQRLALSGFDSRIYDYSSYNGQGTQLELYNFVPYQGSITDVSTAMKINLGLIEQEVIKTFTFNAEQPYVETTIGQGTYSETTLVLLPDFVGQAESVAVNFANKYGINLTIEYIEENQSTQDVGEVHSQSLRYKMDLDAIDKNKGMVITVVEKSKVVEPLNCMLEENEDEVSCAIPTFTGETVEFVKNWFSKYNSYSIEIIYDGDDTLEDSETIITEQSIKSGGLYSLIDNTITFTYEAK